MKHYMCSLPFAVSRDVGVGLVVEHFEYMKKLSKKSASYLG